jgi:glutamyl-tRNA synthetase
MVVERLPRLDAIGPMLDFVFVDDIALDPAALVPKRWDAATTRAGLVAALDVIESIGAVSFEADELEAPLRELADERGWKVGDLFMAIRVAVTGRTATPPLFDTMVAIGYDRSRARLRAAIDQLDRARDEETQHAAVT